MRLSDVRAGDRIELVSAHGAETIRWLVLLGLIEGIPAKVITRTTDGRVVLSICGQTILVPARIARTSIVQRLGWTDREAR